jgi:hypothetical protein
MRRYIFILHVVELQSLDAKATRQFLIRINNRTFYHLPVTPRYLFTDTFYNRAPHLGFDQYNVTLNATANSTLPPVISAAEIFSIISTANVGTYAQDGKLMVAQQACQFILYSDD